MSKKSQRKGADGVLAQSREYGYLIQQVRL